MSNSKQTTYKFELHQSIDRIFNEAKNQAHMEIDRWYSLENGHPVQEKAEPMKATEEREGHIPGCGCPESIGDIIERMQAEGQLPTHAIVISL